MFRVQDLPMRVFFGVLETLSRHNPVYAAAGAAAADDDYGGA